MTWTDDDIALLRRMRADGASVSKMARRLKQPKSQISRKIAALDLPLAFGVRTIPTPSSTHAEPKAKPLRRGARTLPDLA